MDKVLYLKDRIYWNEFQDKSKHTFMRNTPARRGYRQMQVKDRQLDVNTNLMLLNVYNLSDT